MDVSDNDLALIEALCEGLPLVVRPYLALGARVGLDEEETIHRLQHLIEGGIIRRFGVIVRHHRLGYRANAMSVWDVPDHALPEIGARMGRFEFVSLCYRRPRRLPDWPYSLFAMVHGTQRTEVLAQVDTIARELGLEATERDVLFSCRQFKQCGARYGAKTEIGK